MKKNFDLWNRRKKEIHSFGTYAFYHPREVWWCVLGVNVGFEQDGKGIGNQRPVLIIKGFSLFTCLIVPLTTSLKNNPYQVPAGFIAGKEAQAIISQIRLIDTKRLVEKMETVKQDTFDSIRKSIKDML